MHSRIFLLLLCAFLGSLPGRAFAAPDEAAGIEYGGGGSYGASGGAGGGSYGGRLGLHAGAHFGLGQIGTHNPALPQHNEGTFDLQLMPGWRFPNRLMAGLLVDTRFHSQLDDQDASGGRWDYSGQSLLIGIGGTFEPGRLKILLSYDPWARHWVSGKDLTFRGSGFHILLGYKVEPGLSVDMEIVSDRYNSVAENGIQYGIGNYNPVHHWNLGFGMSYSY